MFVGPEGIEPPWFAALTQGPTRFIHTFANQTKMHPTEGVHFSLVGPEGIEPSTHGLKVRCSNRLS